MGSIALLIADAGPAASEKVKAFDFGFNKFDGIFFLGTLVAVLLVGFWTTWRQKTSVGDYFRGGNRLPWYAIGFSIIAACISSEQFVGEVGYAYKLGMPVLNWEWSVLPGLTILLFVFVPLYVRNNISTMPEYLERRFGGEARTLYAWLNVVTYVLANFAIVFYTGGYALEQMWGADPVRPLIEIASSVGVQTAPSFWYVALLALFTGLYTVYGGLEAMAWTSSIQCVLLMGGGIYVFFSGMHYIHWDFAAVFCSPDPARAHLVAPASHSDVPWTALVMMVLSTNTWYYATDQYINQRCLAAPNEWHAKMGVAFAVALQVLIPFAVCFPGMVYYVANPSLVAPGAAPDAHNAAYPNMVAAFVPEGLRGLVAAAVIGAIMSTISGLVNSTSTIFTLDIVRRGFGRNWSEDRLVRIGRWSGGIALLIGALVAPVVMHWSSIFRYCQDIWALMAAPVVVVFICAALWKGAGRRGAVVCLWLSILSVPFTLFKSIYADGHDGQFFPDWLNAYNNTLVLAAPVSLFSWVLMFSLAERWRLWAGVPMAAVLTGGICLLGWWSAPAMAATAGLAIVLGIAVPMFFRSAPSPGCWDQSMLHTDPRKAWYASVWFWWLLLALTMGAIYWHFW
jgi:solute:Na+ symporter, SSS family